MAWKRGKNPKFSLALFRFSLYFVVMLLTNSEARFTPITLEPKQKLQIFSSYNTLEIIPKLIINSIFEYLNLENRLFFNSRMSSVSFGDTHVFQILSIGYLSACIAQGSRLNSRKELWMFFFFINSLISKQSLEALVFENFSYWSFLRSYSAT